MAARRSIPKSPRSKFLEIDLDSPGPAGFEPEALLPDAVASVELIVRIRARLDALNLEIHGLQERKDEAALRKCAARLRDAYMRLHDEDRSKFAELVLHAVLAAGQRLRRKPSIRTTPKAQLLENAKQLLESELNPRALGPYEIELVRLATAKLSHQVRSFSVGTTALDTLVELVMARATAPKPPDVSETVQAILMDIGVGGLSKRSKRGLLRQRSSRARKPRA